MCLTKCNAQFFIFLSVNIVDRISFELCQDCIGRMDEYRKKITQNVKITEKCEKLQLLLQLSEDSNVSHASQTERFQQNKY